MATRFCDALQSCPAVSKQRVVLHVHLSAQRSLRQGHPWLYADAIVRSRHPGRPGEFALIVDRRRKFLALGLWDPTSPIRVRVLQHRHPAPIDQAWFGARLDAAIKQREPLLLQKTTGYRVVHGENDGLPGLLIDRYDRTLVLKLYTVAWVMHLKSFITLLQEMIPCERVVLRLSRLVQQNPEHLCGLTDGMILLGPPLHTPLVFHEHHLSFEVDPIHGQKTGFFLDQRENRFKVESLCAGRSVLDAFAYTGGFSVYAARGGARAVSSLDVNRLALEAARKNMTRNRQAGLIPKLSHQVVVGDAFEVLKQWRDAGTRFDLVILDPPSFAKTKQQIPAALSAYRRLIQLGIGVLHKGGILVASSCSSQVSAAMFFETARFAAEDLKRPLRVLFRTSHPLDHPVRFKEGAYLKCLFAKA